MRLTLSDVAPQFQKLLKRNGNKFLIVLRASGLKATSGEA